MQIGFFACVQYFNLRITYLTLRLNYNNFLKFNMATAILDFQNLISEQRVPLGYRFSITVPNLVRIYWSTRKLWAKIEIQDGGCPPSCNFEKSYFWALGPIRLPILYHCTKFGAKMLIDAEIMAENRNPRCRPSAILNFRKPDFWALVPWAADFLSRYQIWFENIDRRENYGTKSKFKMAAVGHLGFSKI